MAGDRYDDQKTCQINKVQFVENFGFPNTVEQLNGVCHGIGCGRSFVIVEGTYPNRRDWIKDGDVRICGHKLYGMGGAKFGQFRAMAFWPPIQILPPVNATNSNGAIGANLFCRVEVELDGKWNDYGCTEWNVHQAIGMPYVIGVASATAAEGQDDYFEGLDTFEMEGDEE